MIDPRAVEAAYTAMGEFQYGNTYDPNKTAHQTGWSYDQLLAGLEAVAPILQAAALRDAASDLEPHNGIPRRLGDLFREGIDYAQEDIRARADELDPS